MCYGLIGYSVLVSVSAEMQVLVLYSSCIKQVVSMRPYLL